MTSTVCGYAGSKVGVADQIVAALPPHVGYVEPFGGALAVLLAKPVSRCEVVNDLDGDLMTFWRVLRDRPADLERACFLTPHSRAEYAGAVLPPRGPGCPLAGSEGGEVERARRVWVQLTQGRAGTLRPTGWRHHLAPAGRASSMPRTLAGYAGRIGAAAQRLAGVSLESRPALDVVAAYGRQGDVLLYVDPPYLATTRTGPMYRYEMGGAGEHRALADALRACRAAVVVSGYPDALYDDLYAGWDRLDITSATGQGSRWAPRTECLWSNRPLNRQQHLSLTLPTTKEHP
jgi:DNA adenine methylase